MTEARFHNLIKVRLWGLLEIVEGLGHVLLGVRMPAIVLRVMAWDAERQLARRIREREAL